MSSAIWIKVVKDVAFEGWGWVAGRVISFFNIEVTEVDEFGNSISARTLGSVAGAEEGSNRNMMTNGIYKAPSKSIYTSHYLVTSVNNSERIT